MLLADRGDRWGRVQETRRALGLGAVDEASRWLRWFVRADTLWLVWSDSALRAGVALFSSGDSLVGRARAFWATDSLDITAEAHARPLNCWTLERERARLRPRR